MTKTQLIEKVKRRLGYPMIKVELDDTQISDHIDYARSMFIKWAVGHATQEYYFTIPLSAGEISYDMPVGCVEVVGYETDILGGSINTLFTVENILYNLGYYDYLLTTGDPYSLVSYHLAKDMLDSIDRYSPDAYNFHYHKYSNILEINPAPGTTDDGSYLLVRAFFIEGAVPWTSSYIDLGRTTTAVEGMYDEVWILDYVTALSKISLGYIRNKFANFASLGNTGLTLDGDSLISEGKEEKEKLEETLRLEEAWEGYGIEIG
jgi:hypothetical protein